VVPEPSTPQIDSASSVELLPVRLRVLVAVPEKLDHLATAPSYSSASAIVRTATFHPADRFRKLRRTAARPLLRTGVPRRRSSGSARHPPSPPAGATPAVERSWSTTFPPRRSAP